MRRRDLVEGGTLGGEGAGGVGHDPVHLLSHPARLNVSHLSCSSLADFLCMLQYLAKTPWIVIYKFHHLESQFT